MADVEMANTVLNRKIAPYLQKQSREPKTIDFKDIIYSVSVYNEETKEKEMKTILKGVSGKVKAGEMMCILGPSGSGKTSLIQVIAGRIKTTSTGTHNVTGRVTVDNETLSSTSFRRISGLVTQEDIFEGCLTVEETLQFAAALMLQMDPVSRQNRVDEVINLLQLNNCRKTYIGDDANPYMKGISGGEKRRLAIAIEILDPSICFLIADEPTSGLDAASAQAVANLLRSLADEGMTILVTLHQPRNSIMARFDSVMVMAAGRAIYNGPRETYTSYLTDTLQCKIPPHESPYDLLLDALNPAINTQEGLGSIGVIPIGFEGNPGELLADLLDQKTGNSSKGVTVYDSELHNTSGTDASSDDSNQIGYLRWCEVTWTLLRRTGVIKLRDPICLMTQISSAVLMGLIYGVLYEDSYNKSTIEFAILDTQMCVAMTILMAVWLPYDVTLTFPKERRIFLRERKAGLYPTSAFYIARITADAPAHILSAIIMAIIVWSMAKLQIAFFGFMLIMIIGILVGAAIMQCIGAVSRTFEEANIYMMVILMMSMMLGTGFVRETPSWLQWARDISVMGVCADLVMYLEFKDVDPKYGTASDIFSEYGVLITNDDQMWNGILILFYIFLFCRVVCYLCVKFMFTGRTFSEDMKD